MACASADLSNSASGAIQLARVAYSGRGHRVTRSESLTHASIRFLVTLDTRGARLPRGASRAMLEAALKALSALPRSLVRRRLGGRGEASLALGCLSPAEMRRYNRAYRKKDKPTDVLSFSRLDGPRVPGPREIGDVLVCPAVAKRNAAEDGKPWIAELELLVVHGVLHVFGYDHERGGREARRMFRLQERVLSGASPRPDPRPSPFSRGRSSRGR